MKESLRQKQSRFVRLTMLLIARMHDAGYDTTYGAAWREGDPRCHGVRLAIDINLFKGGKFLDKTEDHAQFGMYWKSLAPDASWGGDFDDGNHYSLRHGGYR